MLYKPGDSYFGEFIVSHPTTSAATNADSTPSATMVQNGVDDEAVTLTVTNVETGRYKITGTIPSEYTAGDVIQVVVTATVNSINAAGIVDNFILDSVRFADVLSVAGNINANILEVDDTAVDPSSDVSATLSSSERNSIASAILDLTNGIESSETLRQTLRLLRSVLLGVSTESSGTIVFKRKDGTTTALTVQHDTSGSRSSSTVGTV